MTVQIQTAPFIIHDEIEKLYKGNKKIGAVVTFIGLMRDFNDNQSVSSLFLEHYEGMTEKAIATIIDEAKARWDLQAIQVIHRVGLLHPQDSIVFIGVASSHRLDAFQGCEFLIDYLKNKAPFWKKEVTANGDKWVQSKESDLLAAERWK